jgi:NADH:ubiquinone oxidoreductase subunit 3 (subunit A)
MSSIDNFILVLSSVQPIIIGNIVVFGLGKVYNKSDVLSSIGGVKVKSLNSRIYECGSYTKSNNLLHYSLNTIELLLSYLIYDVDLIFFFSEVTILLTMSTTSLLVLLLFLLLFVVGVFFDYKKSSTT